MARHGIRPPAVLQAGQLTGTGQSDDGSGLSGGRAWLFAAVDGAGELCRSRERRRLVPPAVVLLGPDAGWELRLAPGARFLHLAFAPSATGVDWRTTAAGGLHLAGVDLPVDVPASQRQETLTLMELIRNDYWRHAGANLRATGRLSLLLGSLLCAEIEGGLPGVERPHVAGCCPLVRQALLLLDEHRYALNNRDLARMLDVSPDHLAREVRRDLGIALKTYRDQRRRELVLHLLADTDLSIAQIAGQTGHARVGSLSRAVRRWFGCSPSALRRRAIGSRGGIEHPALYERAVGSWQGRGEAPHNKSGGR